jgi:hypothetical protein
MDELPELSTTVGRTIYDEHFYRGFAALRELLGADSFWSIMSLAVDGPRLDEKHAEIADAISVALLVPDPRLWLFKVPRLVASYGKAMAGIAAGQAFMRNASIGAEPFGRGVRFQRTAARELGEAATDFDAVQAYVDDLFEAGTFIRGFGVPGRPQDERGVHLERWYEQHGRPDSAAWTLYRDLKRAIAARKNLHPNIAGTTAPMWIEMGFDARQTLYMSNAAVLINMVANADDGELQSHAAYRRLPDSAIEYTGPESRVSPRAKAARTNDC